MKDGEIACPKCGCIDTPIVRTSNEGTDTDGNRGKVTTWVECRHCGYEINN